MRAWTLCVSVVVFSTLALGCGSSASSDQGTGSGGVATGDPAGGGGGQGDGPGSAAVGGMDYSTGASQGSGGGAGGSGDSADSSGSSNGSGGAPGGGGTDAGTSSPTAPGGSGDTASGGSAGEGGAPAPPQDGLPADDASNGPPDEDPAEDPDEPPTVECDTESETVLYLSSDDSNSMAGPVVARALIRRGQKVYKAIRTYEFLNYYDFDYPTGPDQAVRVSAGMADLGDGDLGLQIGVRAADVNAEQRRPVNLTLSIDTSSSMGWGAEGDRAIERVKESCQAIAGALRAGDIVSVVTWAQTGQVLLGSHAVEGPGDAALTAACAQLETDGATDFPNGVEKAYELALGNASPAFTNRVVLFSDGGAKVSEADILAIEAHAEGGDGVGVTLIGVGVGDPWNYNDRLMDALTDAGKGAYIYLDTPQEAAAMWGERFVSNVQVAARDVQVQLTLPPTLSVKAFYGEQISENIDEVDPQHLASNDAMVISQVLTSCSPDDLDMDAPLTVRALYQDPLTLEPATALLETTPGELLAQDDALLLKGTAVVAYAEALKDVRDLDGEAATQVLDTAAGVVASAAAILVGDADLAEIQELLATYRTLFDGSFSGGGEPNPSAPTPIPDLCPTCSQDSELDSMACAIGVCSQNVLLEQSYSSPTGSTTATTRAVAAHFGAPNNDLQPKEGGTYSLMATGPATGTSHSQDMSGSGGIDPFSNDTLGIYDAVEWRLKLKAPAGANGFAISYVFFSEEYDDYVGTQYNDKFYVAIEAGSTNGGTPTVINYTRCRAPHSYFDFICSPGMQFCEPAQRYCYVAINTAWSECCWLDGCPNGTTYTDISGTGFECADSAGNDGDHHGSSTGWLTTSWPIEPDEEFELVFHLHDTGDGIFDSEVILDRLEFFDSVQPGTENYAGE